MKEPKNVTDARNRKETCPEMVMLEKEKPFVFPAKSMSENEKKQLDVWVSKWNAACEKNNLVGLKCIFSKDAIL